MENKEIEKIKSYFKDKYVILVGNSVDILKYEWGDTIDSYDIVIRMGAGVNTEERQLALGKKTDVWAFGSMRCKHWKDFKDVDHFFIFMGKV